MGDTNKLVGTLVKKRLKRGISQHAIADRIPCPFEDIVRLESHTDEELSIGDLCRYAKALGLRVGVVFKSIED